MKTNKVFLCALLAAVALGPLYLFGSGTDSFQGKINTDCKNAVTRSVVTSEILLNESTGYGIDTFVINKKGNQAQVTDSDTTEIIILGKKIIIIDTDSSAITIKIEKDTTTGSAHVKKEKDLSVRLFSLDLGSNTYLYGGSLSLPEPYRDIETDLYRSKNISFGILRAKVNLYNHHFHLITGINLDYHNFRFNRDISIVPASDSLIYTKDSVDYKKNKLAARYFSIPLLLQYQSRTERKKPGFVLAAGVYAGLLSKSLTKQVSRESETKKIEDDYNLESMRYGIIMRMGYNRLNFYAAYTLSALFKKGRGPELHPVSAGISITGF